MYSSQYSKVIWATIAAALLLGLQSVTTAALARTETACRLRPHAADASGETGAEKHQRCAIRTHRKALASKRAALRSAHAEVAEAAAHAPVEEAAAHPLFAEALPHAPVGEAAAQAEAAPGQEEQRPVATHCIAAPGQPSRRGAWQVAIDRATGHKCWQLVGTNKRDPRTSPRAKPSPARNSFALSPRVTAASTSPATAPAAIGVHGPSQPSEVATNSVAKPAIQQVNLGQSPVSPAPGVVSKPGEVNQGELPPFDLRFAWTADKKLNGTSEALAATDPAPTNMSGGNMLEKIAAFMPVRDRSALFLVVFLSVLTTILALYGLVAGSFALARSTRRPPAIRLTPQLYLDDMSGRDSAAFGDEHLSTQEAGHAAPRWISR